MYTPKGQATREHILRSAAEVLVSGGLSGFNLDKVRRTGSVSGSQLTHYFVDRRTLIQAVVERQIEVVLAFHEQPRIGGLDTFSDWEQWADRNVQYLRKIGYRGTPAYHVLAGQLVKSDEATRRSLAAGYQRWIDLLEASFGRMKDAGLLVDWASPRALAVVAVAAHQGAGVLAFSHHQEWPMTDGCQFVVNHVRGFAAEPGERGFVGPRRRHRLGFDADVSGGGDIPLQFTAKGLATRARIVRGAADLIFAGGVHRMTLGDVRRSVGISGSQLSHYFVDKGELVRAVIALRARDVREFESHTELGRIDSVAALRKWAEIYLAQVEVQYLQGGCIYGSLVGEVIGDDGILEEVTAGYRQWLQSLQNGLATMARSSALHDEADLDHLAAVLLIAHQGGALLTYTTGTADPFRLAITAAVDYVAWRSGVH
jgi:AcrR family transcriptional regulator